MHRRRAGQVSVSRRSRTGSSCCARCVRVDVTRVSRFLRAMSVPLMDFRAERTSANYVAKASDRHAGGLSARSTTSRASTACRLSRPRRSRAPPFQRLQDYLTMNMPSAQTRQPGTRSLRRSASARWASPASPASPEMYGKPDEAEGIATIQRALELGVTFFDTARGLRALHQRGPWSAARSQGRRDQRHHRDEVRLQVSAPTARSPASGQPARANVRRRTRRLPAATRRRPHRSLVSASARSQRYRSRTPSA